MFEPVFMRLALIASIATGASLGILGVYLIIRRVVFLGLVLANAATVGAALAEVFDWPPEIVAIATSVAAAVGLGLIQRPRRVSAESVMGWAYAAASSAPVLILSAVAAPDADTLHMLFGNLLAVSVSHAAGLVIVALIVGMAQILFSQRFLLVTFDAEAAQVAGVNARSWTLGLNLLVGVAAAAAVHEIGALLTFALLTLPAMAALLVTTSIRATFTAAATLGAALPCLGLALVVLLRPASGSGIGGASLCQCPGRGRRWFLEIQLRRLSSGDCCVWRGGVTTCLVPGTTVMSRRRRDMPGCRCANTRGAPRNRNTSSLPRRECGPLRRSAP